MFYSDIEPPAPPAPEVVPGAIVFLERKPVRPARPRPDRRAPLSQQWPWWMVATWIVLSVTAPPAVSWWFGLVMVGALLRLLFTRR